MTKKPTRPTEAELEILQVLWGRGPSTVRELHEALSPSRGTGYTTVLKLLQIMAEKGLVGRDERQKSHVYRALLAERPAKRRLVGELIDRVFSGSASALVVSALSEGRASREELAEIRALLDELERGGDE
jgi:BlaI family transcriptional regulator, penicillinase repressor